MVAAIPLVIPLALKLMEYVPQLTKWIAGDKAGAKAETVAGTVLDIAKSVTGELDPERAVAVIRANVELQTRFREMAIQYEIGLAKEDTRQIAQVNMTMRTESKSEHWPQWLWRPFIGFCTGASFSWVSWRLCDALVVAIGAKDYAFIGQLPAIIGALVALFSIPASILGIAAWGRNKLKIEQEQQGCGIKTEDE